jgi:hypothetical protein
VTRGLALPLFKRLDKPPPKSLEEFLCDQYWLKREQLPGCPDVFKALGLAGDDCFDFTREFSAFFGIDLGTYDWSRFHFSEGEELSLLYALRRMFGRGRLVYPISVAHLEKVYREKRWIEPDPIPPRRAGRSSR